MKGVLDSIAIRGIANLLVAFCCVISVATITSSAVAYARGLASPNNYLTACPAEQSAAITAVSLTPLRMTRYVRYAMIQWDQPYYVLVTATPPELLTYFLTTLTADLRGVALWIIAVMGASARVEVGGSLQPAHGLRLRLRGRAIAHPFSTVVAPITSSAWFAFLSVAHFISGCDCFSA